MKKLTPKVKVDDVTAICSSLTEANTFYLLKKDVEYKVVWKKEKFTCLPKMINFDHGHITHKTKIVKVLSKEEIKALHKLRQLL